MKFIDYHELRQRAEEAGIKDSSALKQLLHLIQAKQVAIRHHEKYLEEMNRWERNCYECVVEEINKVGEQNDSTGSY